MNNLSLSGHRKPSWLILRMSSHFWVSLREGIKYRGCAKRGLRDNKGSSGNCRVTCVSSGKVAGTGRCFLLTAFYCLLASHLRRIWYWTETWDGRTWAWVFCCTGRDWIVKEFQILELEFEVGIDESMRGETWVSVSLMSFRTELDWEVRCRQLHNSHQLPEGASDESLRGEKDDDDVIDDSGGGQINDYWGGRWWCSGSITMAWWSVSNNNFPWQLQTHRFNSPPPPHKFCTCPICHFGHTWLSHARCLPGTFHIGASQIFPHTLATSLHNPSATHQVTSCPAGQTGLALWHQRMPEWVEDEGLVSRVGLGTAE